MKRQSFLAVAAVLIFSHSPAFAETINHAEQYKACMGLVRQAPDKAFDSALTWKGLGGGDAAEHCISAALIGMKRYKTGAQRLEHLADTSRRTQEFKAELLAQAAQAWYLAGDIERARAVLTTAIGLDNSNADLYVDRAQMRSARKHYNDALDDLNQALALDDINVDAYVFRGTIYRLTENMDAAWRDIAQALALAPGNAEALLERGMLYRLKGDDAKAREDWLATIEIDPQSVAAETARLNIEKMDVKTD